MSAFQEFLSDRLCEYGPFTTEDALTSFVPLARQVAEAHAAGRVAPLAGLEAIRVDDGRLWYEDSRETLPKHNRAGLKRLEPKPSGVEVLTEWRVTRDVEDGHAQEVRLDIGKRGEELTRPVYLPGYVCWEHEIEHHDPLTDTFSLGLILASMVCGLDLNDEAQLAAFVQHRGNLFAQNPGLHPVLARAVTAMTELDRHRRPQDLAALLESIENYREQSVDFDTELTRVEGFAARDRRGKQQVVRGKLQERLFELSRRNRLLQFRLTMHTVNLTHASVPLSMDVRNIRADRLVTWAGRFRKEVLSQNQVPLNRYLNFREAIYVPSVLDRIRVEAARDRKEFGFAQLRLVVVFLRWANLKESPPELYQSPLLLLPVELARRKGIQDTYLLRLAESEAEVNPVVRYLFRQLYGIDLPESVDLTSTTVDEFHEELSAKIGASDRGVTLQRIDRPRIDVIFDKARRRLEQYRRRMRVSGRGVKSFLDLDYSYDAANYHPLGLRLFNEVVRPATTHLRDVISTGPPRPRYAVEPAGGAVVEAQRSFYALREREQNPFVWEFDRCSVTLANMKYRKMSLVRDYEELAEALPENVAFDAVFSLAPKPLRDDDPAPLPLEEQYHVVPCDPTQAQAIADARTRTSYIIQGPPGTGKSQTITNLIADYVARGKRVLFVCEKRAAIDVVYQRLKQRGLHELCCLIHDSQADKKQFVMDLKQTYETFLEESKKRRNHHRRHREKVIGALSDALKPLEEFQAAMVAEPASVGTSVCRLLARLVELRSHVSELTPRESERLPFYGEWEAHRSELQRLYETMREFQRDGVPARHALSRLSCAVASQERPIEFVTACLERSRALLDQLTESFSHVEWPHDEGTDLALAEQVSSYACDAAFLAPRRLIQLTDAGSAASKAFRKRLRALGKLKRDVQAKRRHASGWRQRLSRDEVRVALEQARALEGRFLSLLKPAWWRLRGVLNRSYDFASRAVRPTWVQVLETLESEYAAIERHERKSSEICEEFGIGIPLDAFRQRLKELVDSLSGRPVGVRRLHEHLVESNGGGRALRRLQESRATLGELKQTLAQWLAAWEDCRLDQLQELFTEIDEALDELPDYVPCLREMTQLNDRLSHALRTLPLSAVQMEAAAAHRTLEEVYREQLPLRRYDGHTRRRQLAQLDRAWGDWQTINAATVREAVRQRFVDGVRISSQPAAQLTREQKQLKAPYSRARRELEHEFGKTMRYKAIRDLVSGDSGLVVRDLKPVWLMSPLSVSDTLPLHDESFDVVIFDEASQITLEEAVPSLFRAKQAIVVGDEMQLPPTDFFSARRAEDEEGLTFEEGGELIAYDLNSDSLLNHAGRNLPSRMLGWHYRSRSESLISFSNRCFYGGRLLTVPEETVAVGPRPELAVHELADADRNAEELLKRAVSFHFVHGGVYEKRRNRAEAEYVARVVRSLLRAEPRRSIGVVAFSEAQQDEIDQALRRLAEDDRSFAEQLEAELEREEDGQFVGLLVKNLENIQGDERDVVIMSVCYGPDAHGRVRMNFGPINKSGGEKRLNVAFSRAKHHMALVSSMRHGAIVNEYNDGANCLKNYLRYAEATSVADRSCVEQVLRSLSPLEDEQQRGETDAVVAQVAEALRTRGWTVDLGVGHSQFRCDLAVRRAGEDQYRLGILVDTAAWYAQTDLIERELMKPALLESFGWSVAVVLTKDWYHEPEQTLERLERRLAGESETEPEAVADAPDAAPVEAEVEDPIAEGEPAGPLAEENSLRGGSADRAPLSEREATQATDPASGEPGGADSGGTDGDVEHAAAPEMRRYLEYIEGRSAKFWEISVRGRDQCVRFGRIGSAGQTRTRRADTPEQARADAERQINKKLAKGYRDKT